jgi:DNA (cytosine-5)-methyltransferase 1
LKAEIVDLFCGVGGLTRGLINSGFKVKAGFDFDNTCEFAYSTNNKTKFIVKDIKNTTADDINALFAEDALKILVGCAPCQPFSNMRKKFGSQFNQNDDKYNLLLEFGRLINEIQPDIVSMENVPNIRKTNVFKEFLEILKNNNYNVDYRVVYCPDYGIAQNRRRFVLLASKLGSIELKNKTHDKTTVRVDTYIKNLPCIGAGEQDKKDPLHISTRLSDLNIKRIKVSKAGGNWHDWPKELVAECHKKESGKTFTTPYSRMCWDKIGPTITTQFMLYGTGRFGHPEQDRAISLREGALLQTFPPNYEFLDPTTPLIMKNIARHIGNAVPVRLGEVIGESINKHLDIYHNCDILV